MEFISTDASDLTAPNITVENKLLMRMKQRTDEVAQRSEERRNRQTNRNTETENADAFLVSFNEMKEKLEEDIASVDEENSDTIMEQFDKMVRDHGYIQQFLNESQVFLPLFRVKRSQEILIELYIAIQNKMELSIPKKRFGFRSKTKSIAKTCVNLVKFPVFVILFACPYAVATLD